MLSTVIARADRWPLKIRTLTRSANVARCRGDGTVGLVREHSMEPFRDLCAARYEAGLRE